MKLMAAATLLTLPAVAGAVYFLSAGRWDLPYAWGVLGLLACFSLIMVALGDPGLIRERVRPGPGNQDRLTRPLSMLFLLAHWILAGLDVGRFQWSVVPWGAQMAGLIGYALSLAALFWIMRTNPFYSSVVRVQTERGHHPIVTGPYRIVRHPGYAASLLAMLSGGIAFGSWLAMLPVLASMGLFVRRTLLEDRLLQKELPGYAEYAQRVRYRLIVGVF